MRTTTKASAYARGCSDQMCEKSVRKQIRNCRAAARRAGWTVVRIASE